MEVFREAKGDECSRVVKGKRSKRGRSLRLPAMSSTSSIEVSGTTTEEEEEVDMANCLILLAQGRGLDTDKCVGGEDGGEKFTSRRYVEESGDGKSGTYVYQCRTCNKCFASFQALGGHRTSHKRLKMAADISVAPISPDGNRSNTTTTTSATTTITTNKSRVHECLICGLEFSSGQALGGHMRRHRPVIAPPSLQEEKKEKNVFSLDLNLPAPTDDDQSQPSSYGMAMVDCHY